jgi:hypothetical protein
MMLSAAPVSNASAFVGCTVGPGNDTCTFECRAQPPAGVWFGGTIPDGGDAGATITATCGADTTSCTAGPASNAPDNSCVTRRQSRNGGPGECTLVDFGEPDVVARCGIQEPWVLPGDDRYRHCPHMSPHAHTYGSGGSTGARSDSASAGRTAGFTTVSDGNTVDCDENGVPGDFDGDYETGTGGAFFGYGPWADEPLCGYGLRPHGSTVTVYDTVFGHDVQFTIGADDTSGPVVNTDPFTGETSCETDGAITPGDPSQDPTRDADDCLTPVIDGGDTNGEGTTCGAGGDGGYWVFLIGARVHESATGVAVNNPATQGTITA